jgi:dipeptidyl-peptidase-4
VKITASDGTELHGAVYKSDAGQFGQPPSQAVVSVYEGPNAQTICNSWMHTVTYAWSVSLELRSPCVEGQSSFIPHSEALDR